MALGGEVLLLDAVWFTRIRWFVALTLLCLGALGILIPEATATRFGLVLPRLWPFALATLLALLNLITLRWLRRIRSGPEMLAVVPNIWFQIASDLVVLSALTTLMGPTGTPIGFAFLFHIVLACIFFGRRDSFLVALLSAGLFLGAVAASECALIPRSSILTSGPTTVAAGVIQAVFTVFVMFVVWYLTSSISDAVRLRDFELDGANARLRQADEDKNQQMLRTTHDLKAPFSGIEGNIHVLRHLHWDSLPEEVQAIIEKIEMRSGTLRSRIGEILTLGRLRSGSTSEVSEMLIVLKTLLCDVIEELAGLATEQGVTVAVAGDDISARCDPGQLKILFMNLISNAISYSKPGGRVEVDVRDRDEGCLLVVTDHGIGISPEAVPHIFEDFYRSQEAAKFNPKSTGLGLAIVRQIGQNLNATIKVQSEVGKGTSFTVCLPTPTQAGAG
ncbi:MAG: HAMP domain-containing histidine kinase [Verrucomicrobia bacterium]|nr:HAMP domain-containing histidine kinase [Verrucomicrobiota bacterium]